MSLAVNLAALPPLEGAAQLVPEATIPKAANLPELSPFDQYGPDAFFVGWLVTAVAIVVFSIFWITKPYWEQRWLIERVNKQKLKFITQADSATPVDQFELGRMYVALLDYPSAIAEFEEVEEEFDDVRKVLNPEDAMGALAARAQLHNSKGFALMQLEPPRVAAARREFVRSVTYWPEYPEALVNIGRELMKRQRFDVALRTLNTALKWQPGTEMFQEAAEMARRGMDGELSRAELIQLAGPKPNAPNYENQMA